MNVGFALPGLICLGLFAVSYLFILLEEFTHLRKSKPAILGACLIWVIIALIAPSYEVSADQIHHAILDGLNEFAAGDHINDLAVFQGDFARRPQRGTRHAGLAGNMVQRRNCFTPERPRTVFPGQHRT